jgi:hypothetical protein
MFASQDHLLKKRISFKSLLVMMKKLCPHLYALTLVCSSNLIVEIPPNSDILCLNGWTYNSLQLILVLCSFSDFYLPCTNDEKLSCLLSYSIHPSCKNLKHGNKCSLRKTQNQVRKISLLVIPIVINPHLTFFLPCMRF